MSKARKQGDFFERVLDVVAQIPYGRVTTYGHIAEHLGTRSASRAVGWALNGVRKMSPSPSPMELPCHRVVNRFGGLTGKRHFATPDLMEERLRAEGVNFDDEGCVKLERHLWIPGVGPLNSQSADPTIPPPAMLSSSCQNVGKETSTQSAP